MGGEMVLCNRQPSLQQTSTLMHRVRVLQFVLLRGLLVKEAVNVYGTQHTLASPSWSSRHCTGTWQLSHGPLVKIRGKRGMSRGVTTLVIDGWKVKD